jgi:hypothetical protein
MSSICPAKMLSQGLLKLRTSYVSGEGREAEVKEAKFSRAVLDSESMTFL